MTRSADRGRERDRFYARTRRARDPRLAAAQAIRNGRAWRRLSAAFRLEHPLCALCLVEGRERAAVDVDHKEPLAIRPDLAYEWGNLQALCRACHNRKTDEERRTMAARLASANAEAGPAPDWADLRARVLLDLDDTHPMLFLVDRPRDYLERVVAVRVAAALREERARVSPS